MKNMIDDGIMYLAVVHFEYETVTVSKTTFCMALESFPRITPRYMGGSMMWMFRNMMFEMLVMALTRQLPTWVGDGWECRWFRGGMS